jgi:hypothetical protein
MMRLPAFQLRMIVAIQSPGDIQWRKRQKRDALGQWNTSASTVAFICVKEGNQDIVLVNPEDR